MYAESHGLLRASSDDSGGDLSVDPLTLPIFPETSVWDSAASRFTRWQQNCSVNSVLEAALPCVRWLKTYKWRAYFLSDVLAGLAVGVMAVPQCVSFALMAGLPSAYGLYSAFLPVLAYALTGSSPHLAVGPVALVSLLLSEGLTKVIPGAEVNANPNRPADPAVQKQYNHAAIQVSLLVSIIYLVLGFLRLGFVTHFLSRPIISAFLTAGTIIISFSQVKYLLGYNVPRANQLHKMLYSLVSGLHQLRWPELLMGLSWIALLLSIRRVAAHHRRFQWIGALGPISVASLSIITVYLGNLQEQAGIAVVGSITAGLPEMTASWWLPMDNFPQLAATAVVISFVSLLESISIARALAEPQQDVLHPLDANQELLGLGWANLAGAAFNSYPTTGSFARSAVAKYTGAKSGLAGVVTAGLASKPDWLVWMVVFLGCLFVGIDWGLAFGVGLSILIQLGHITFPEIQVLGRIPATAIFRNVEQYPHAGATKGVLILRVVGPLCFANVEHIRDCLAEHEAVSVSKGEPLQSILLDVNGASHMDTTAAEAVKDWREGYERTGVHLALIDPNPQITMMLQKTGMLDSGDQLLFPSAEAALLHIQQPGAVDC